jgi:hypothetical protein
MIAEVRGRNEVVVNYAIAVVVETVAGLGLWRINWTRILAAVTRAAIEVGVAGLAVDHGAPADSAASHSVWHLTGATITARAAVGTVGLQVDAFAIAIGKP